MLVDLWIETIIIGLFVVLVTSLICNAVQDVAKQKYRKDDDDHA